MKKTIRLFTTMMVCMAMTLCVSCKKDDDKSDGGNHEYVDFDLPSGLLWATCNVGADLPEDYGNYYAWGETGTKGYYDWSTYRWCNGNYNNLTKYCTDSDYGIVDNKKVLDPEDDVAHVNWGGAWRMPTKDDWQELKDNCIFEWIDAGKMSKKVTSFTAVTAGYLVVKGNSNELDNVIYMFLPAAGYYHGGILDSTGSRLYYWSSSLGTDFPSSAYYLFLEGMFSEGVLYDNNRCCGRSVRPVCSPQK